MNTLKKIKPCLTALILTYMSISFISKEINPFLWKGLVRFFFVIISGIMSGIIYDMKKDD